jgi:RNA polymerase sigma-70 factor (ECF subfamily)
MLLDRAVDSDEGLIERTRQGELAAFELLVHRHRNVVYRTAARIVGPTEAEDVTQDAFLRAYHRLDQYSGRGAFRTWLLQITQNAAFNTLARARRRPTDSDLESHHIPDRDPVRQPAARLEDRERARRLELKLGALRPEYRTLLVLRDLEGLSYTEIAEILGMPLGTVKGRLHRARDQLIDLLRHNTYDWELPA